MKNNFSIKYKIWLSSVNTRGVYGDGKQILFETVGRLGSLTAACKELKISYRKAWGDVKKAEKGLGIQLIELKRGGISGGTAILTEEGKKLIKAYKRLSCSIKNTIDKNYQIFLKEMFYEK